MKKGKNRQGVFDVIWMKPDHESSHSIIQCKNLESENGAFQYGVVSLSRGEMLVEKLVASWDRSAVTTQWLTEADVNRRFKLLAIEADRQATVSIKSMKRRQREQRRKQRKKETAQRLREIETAQAEKTRQAADAAARAAARTGEAAPGAEGELGAKPAASATATDGQAGETRVGGGGGAGDNGGAVAAPFLDGRTALELYEQGHHQYALDLSAGAAESVPFAKLMHCLLLELPFRRLRGQLSALIQLQKCLNMNSARTTELLRKHFGKDAKAFASTPNTPIGRAGFRAREVHDDVVIVVLCEMLHTLNQFYHGAPLKIENVMHGGEQLWEQLLSQLSEFGQRATGSQSMRRAQQILGEYEQGRVDGGGVLFLKNDCVERIDFMKLDKGKHFLR